MRARESKAGRLMLDAARRLAADLRAAGQPARSLESLGRALVLVPREARRPLHLMRAQLFREMGRPEEAREAEAEAALTEGGAGESR